MPPLWERLQEASSKGLGFSSPPDCVFFPFSCKRMKQYLGIPFQPYFPGFLPVRLGATPGRIQTLHAPASDFAPTAISEQFPSYQIQGPAGEMNFSFSVQRWPGAHQGRAAPLAASEHWEPSTILVKSRRPLLTGAGPTVSP